MDVKGDFLQSSKKKKFKVLQFDYLNAYYVEKGLHYRYYIGTYIQ